jgi:hypothetical protein
MAMWIKSSSDLGEHWKTIKLSELLGVDIPKAIGHLHLLWHFSLRNTWRDGDLYNYTPQAISEGAGWKDDPAKFIHALHKSGFLDGMKIHDWLDYCGELVHKRLRYEREREENKRRNLRDVSENSLKTVNQIQENSRHRIEENRKEEKHPNAPSLLPQSELTPEILVKLWNDSANGFPKVNNLTDQRRKKAATRLYEHPHLTFWETVIRKTAESDFCNGRKKGAWKATFDWLIKNDTNCLKVYEGNFDNKHKQEEQSWLQAKKK